MSQNGQTHFRLILEKKFGDNPYISAGNTP